jgi:hypothetical protein
MANLPESDQFDTGVYQWETTDPALGGANGIMNTPGKSFANRTRYLLNRIIDGALSFIIDSGAQNAIVVSLPQPAQALVDGMEVSFRVAYSNNSAVTLKLTNTGGPALATLPLYGGDHVPLVGGELPAGASVRAKLNMALNSTNGGAWVISSITGGFAKIPTAPIGDATTKAANMAAVFNATDGIAAVNVGVNADIVLTAAQYGCAILKLTGTPTAAINLVLPAQSGNWIIINNQGGTNNITVKPNGGAGVVLPQGNPTVIVCSDGTTATFASAQAGQAAFTAITITGQTGNTLTVPGGFTPGAFIIEKNGAMLESGDFTATVSPTITLTQAAVATDVFTVYRFNTFNVANAVQKTGDVLAGPLQLFGGDTIATAPGAGDSSAKIPTTAWVGANTHGRLIGVQVFTANGTYTPTAGTTSIIVEAVGGGAGGGGCPATGSGQASAATSGTSGQYAKARFTAGFSGVTVTIGAAGAAGPAASGASGGGGGGGNTSFGSLLTVLGGIAGSGGIASTYAAPQFGPPAVVSTPATITGGMLLNQTFRKSGSGIIVLGSATQQVAGGSGGDSPFGQGGPGGSGAAGVAATGYGAGGGGCSQYAGQAGSTGGAGSPGIMIIYEYA